MSPHPDPVGLEALFEQVDGWFADLTSHEPISHYARVRKKTSPATKSNGGSNNSNNNNGNSNTRKPTLDSLARDLELLLEEPDEVDEKEDETTPQMTKNEPEIFHFNICNNDELALLDDLIGSCYVTYGTVKDEDAMSWTSITACNTKEYSVSVQSHEDRNSSADNQPKDSGRGRRRSGSIDNNRENNDLKVQTSMPIDHDYLSEARTTHPNPDSHYLLRKSKRMDVPVLHTGVIKRFAKFSSRFRELSMRNDRSLVAINNSHNKVEV